MSSDLFKQVTIVVRIIISSVLAVIAILNIFLNPKTWFETSAILLLMAIWLKK
jgi:hypothetical protein